MERSDMTDDRGFYDKLNSDHYQPRFAGPSIPTRPKLLDIPAGSLTPDELEQLPAVRRKYEEDLRAYEEVWAAYREVANQRDAEFTKDLFVHHGIPEDDSFGWTLYSLAYESGHAYGHSEVASHFSRLIPAWEQYNKLRTALASCRVFLYGLRDNEGDRVAIQKRVIGEIPNLLPMVEQALRKGA
jgi:hypothetical protein